MIVCICHRVSDRDIAREVAHGCGSFDELQERTRVATACGACHEFAQDTFCAHAGGSCRDHRASMHATVVHLPEPKARPVATLT